MRIDVLDKVPSVDLKQFTQGTEKERLQFVEELGSAFNEIGFVAIKGHYLTNLLAAQLYDEAKQFFALDESLKKSYELPELNGQRGYVGKGKEHAKDHSVGDLKEFFHIGQEENKTELGYPDNIDVKEQPKFLSTSLEVYRVLEKTGITMLRAIALYLGLEENYFDLKVRGGNSILRPIHYYPIENPEAVPADAVRAAAHGDINLITLLMGASADGLQILRRDNTWIPVTALSDHLIVNVGDMLERLTNNKLRSTVHRVVNPPREKMQSSRYSIPFFMHPRSDMDLSCLSSCVDDEHIKEYEDITAGEFLEQRLLEIGLRA